MLTETYDYPEVFIFADHNDNGVCDVGADESHWMQYYGWNGDMNLQFAYVTPQDCRGMEGLGPNNP